MFLRWSTDIIVKKDGTTILSNVIKVSENEVEYRKFQSTSERYYTISTSEILSINYEDGDRDFFDKNQVSESDNNNHGNSQQKIDKPAEGRNQELIDSINRDYMPVDGKFPKSDKLAKGCIYFYGVTSNSIMSNEDIEIRLEKKIELDPHLNREFRYYYLNINNKTIH